MAFQLPQNVLLKIQEHGEQGRLWLQNLDKTVAQLAKQWHLQIAEILQGGSESIVFAATQVNDTQVALKLGIPNMCDTAKEANIYRLAAGKGYPRLLVEDKINNAILMEQLGLPLTIVQASMENQLQIMCQTLADAWIESDAPQGFLSGAEKARSLAEYIQEMWQTLNAPCSGASVEQALGYAAARENAYDPHKSLLVHGDVHGLNTLQCIDNPKQYKFIDPDGIFAEPELDLGVMMRDFSQHFLAGDTLRLAQECCQMLASLTTTDANAIWQWSFLERMSTGLLLLKIGLTDEGKAMLSVADCLSARA
ncbi:MAG: aminoglycoside phosphotransferase family protein [Deinococcota bacterium]